LVDRAETAYCGEVRTQCDGPLVSGGEVPCRASRRGCILDNRLSLRVNTVLDGSYRIVRVVGAGGFAITYEAEDIHLGTPVALKEYYPVDFGDRESTMRVRPKSERHRNTFEWGRSNFLQEARTLARFEHPSIVRVTRVFETNATAYMVMRFEEGDSFEAWLRSLGRPPSQEELDRIVAPLLEALQIMHAKDFLHRDIAPDNILVRTNGSPVLLDFGAARRAVAEMSRSLTGIVKAGYSPHEQYSSDSRQQGPWSDFYALGATLYRAIAGVPPEEVTLRVDHDRMPPAAAAATSTYRPKFLAGIDACLRVRSSERPQSVSQLRTLLLAPVAAPAATGISMPPTRRLAHAARSLVGGRWPVVAAGLLALLAAAYGGFEYARWQAGRGEARHPRPPHTIVAQTDRTQLDTDAKRPGSDVEAARRQAELDAVHRRREEAERIADAEAEAARRANAETEERRKEQERARIAIAVLGTEERATFVKRVQMVLKEGRCYDGAVSGRSGDAQEGIDRFVAAAAQKGNASIPRIELANATAADFAAWLREAGEIKGQVCTPAPASAKPETAKAPARRDPGNERPSRRASDAKPQGQSAGGARAGSGGTCGGWMFYNTSCTDSAGRTCRQTPGGRRCE
jgi:tRNA A-37 threonylcarbamoyl transferase component Bud32